MSRTYRSLKVKAMAFAIATIAIVFMSALAPMAGTSGIVGGAKADSPAFQPPIIRGNITLPSPTPAPHPSLSIATPPIARQLPSTPTSTPTPSVQINYSLIKLNKNFTYVPLPNNSVNETSMAGYITFDSPGYYVPEDGILKVNVTRYGGAGNETFTISAISWQFNLSEIGWTNVTGTIHAPGTYEFTLPVNVSSDKGLAGKYFFIVLNPVSPNCKVTEPDISTVSILDKNGSSAKATVKLSAAAYESDASYYGAAFATVHRAGGSGVVWMKLTLAPVMIENTPTPQPNSTQQGYYSEIYCTYSGVPDEYLSFAITDKHINGFLGYEFSPVGPVRPDGDVVCNLSVTLLDDNFAELGAPSSAIVTVHHNGTATISPNLPKLNTSRSLGQPLGSIIVKGSPDNPEVSSVTEPGAAAGPDVPAPGGEGQGNPATDVHLNPQPEPPKPGGFFDGIVNSVKNMFGLK